MEIETIKGIEHIDLDSVSLIDVSNIISRMSVDAGVDDSAKTILYSGSINGYKIAKKYHGKCDFYEEDSFFCCSVTLRK
jgi:hypothetical protein